MTNPYDMWDAQKTQPPREPTTPSPAQYGNKGALTALEREIEAVCTAANGTRNHQLNRSTFNLAQLVAGGELDETEVRTNLTAAAQTAGLDDDEITATINSGFRAGTALPRTIHPLEQYPDVTALATPEHTNAPEHTSWWYRDLAPVLAGEQTDLTPTVLHRTDQQALFYPGRVNGLIGESESGKTWVALLAVAQTLADTDDNVLYLDFEDSASGIISRLRALTVTDTQLKRFAYIDPDESLGTLQQTDLSAVLAEHKPALIIVDGFNAAMTLLGLNLESNTDATTFAQKLLKPLSFTGATVIYIDHLPKNKDSQMKGAIGAQAKRAMTTGCALKVEVVQEFGRGMVGKLRLTVDKDRAGYVRANSAQAKNAGVAVLVSDATTGAVQLVIEAPDLRPAEQRTPFRPTVLMEKVSRFLETFHGAASGRQVTQNVPGREQYVKEALGYLVEDGFVERTNGPRNSVNHTSTEPYRDTTASPPPTVSAVHPGMRSVSASAHPTPYRGDALDAVSHSTGDTLSASEDLVPDVRSLMAGDR